MSKWKRRFGSSGESSATPTKTGQGLARKRLTLFVTFLAEQGDVKLHFDEGFRIWNGCERRRHHGAGFVGKTAIVHQRSKEKCSSLPRRRDPRIPFLVMDSPDP